MKREYDIMIEGGVFRGNHKVNKLEVGVSTPEDLQRIFGSKVSLKEEKYKSVRKSCNMARIPRRQFRPWPSTVLGTTIT